MLCTNLEQLQRARREGYAIPAINTQGGSYDIIMAIGKAAEELKSPVILAHYVATGAYSGHDWFVQVAKWCANKVSVPVSIHLDHGSDFDICMEALRLGFTSVMIDGSMRPVRENAELTQSVVKVARCFGVPVEAEIGELQRLDNTGAVLENKNVADPEQVREFLSLCSPDTLAIGIGNAHGLYAALPKLRYDVVEQAHAALHTSLVLHGGSGLSDFDFQEAARRGICKVNIFTDLDRAGKVGIRNGLNAGANYLTGLIPYEIEAMKEVVRKKINLFGSNGKA